MDPIDTRVTDDLRYTMLPRWFSEYWNYPRQKSLVLLERLVTANRLPQFSIFLGPPSSGKNAAAYVVAMAASCPDPDPATKAPCGRCRACNYVRLGRDSWRRDALLEIEGATKRSANAATDDIYEAFATTLREVWVSDRRRVVFINEAQRLTPTTREALLTLLERWDNAHVIAATTDITRLQVEPGVPPRSDPLITRADVFQFDLPNVAEAVAGLLKAAKAVGLELTEDAARLIARQNTYGTDAGRVVPRQCLGDLYKLQMFGPTIGVEDVAKIRGWDMAEPHSATPPVVPHHEADDRDVVY